MLSVGNLVASLSLEPVVKTAAMGVLQRVMIAICILLTLAFGVCFLCASSIMKPSMSRHISAPCCAHVLIHAVAPEEGKETPNKSILEEICSERTESLVRPERIFHKSFASNQESINCALKTVWNAKSHADEHGQGCSDHHTRKDW
jgi:hypothetical protein